MVSLRHTQEINGRITLRAASVRYGRLIALEAISGDFASGSMTAVVGANGAGKSTLLAAIAGIVPLSGGAVDSAAPERLAYLPQHTALDRDYPISVSELITLGGWREFGPFHSPNPAVRGRAAAAAETVGLSDRVMRSIGQLSVGELQRALFARLILQDPAVILLDEPFAGVDSQTVSVLLGQLTRWHEEGRTIIAVLHDLSLVRAHFASTVVLARRCLAWENTDTALSRMAA